jgi:hypothetical protein
MTCGYKSASGRHEWPNKDPLEEPGFALLEDGHQFFIDRSNVKKFKERQIWLLAEQSKANRYQFVCNNPMIFSDSFGLEELVLQYDLNERSLANGIDPFGVTREISLDALVADSKSRVKSCDCIRKLRIGAHGQAGAIIGDAGEGTYIGDSTFNDYNKALDDPDLLNYKTFQQDYHTVELLISLAKLMCKNGQVEFISCHSFAGADGSELKSDLESIFGSGNVIGYTTTVTWGLFGGVTVGNN